MSAGFRRSNNLVLAFYDPKIRKNARKLHEQLIGLTAAVHHAENLINAVAKRCHKDTADAVRV